MVQCLDLDLNMVTGLWYTHDPNFGSSTWFWRCKEHLCPLIPPKNKLKQRNPNPKGHQTSVEGILFCPYTKESALKRELEKVEAYMNGNARTGKVRIVERAGPKMSSLLANRNPWKKERCGRPECPLCDSKAGTCRALNPTYKLTCMECASTGRKPYDIVEGSRSFYDRSREHVQALKDKNQEYAIVNKTRGL